MNLAICATGFSQSKCQQVDSGVVNRNVYTNGQLGVSYTLPANTELQQNGLPTGTGDSKLLLVLWSKPHTVEKPNVIILSDNPKSYADASALGYAKRILNTAIKYGSGEVLSPPKRVDLGGHEFYTVQYRYPAGPTYASALTGQLNGCEISFQFSAASQPELNNLVRSTETLKISPPAH
jgi:hypothetical protein